MNKDLISSVRKMWMTRMALLVLLCAGAAVGCSDDDDGDGGSALTSSEISKNSESTVDRSDGSSKPPGASTAGSFEIYISEPNNVDLHWQDPAGDSYGQLERLREDLENDGLEVNMLTNAGIYQPDLTPAGLHIENGQTLKSLNEREGAGNFHLLPNGVFYIDSSGNAGVLETLAYSSANIEARLATQSGPMLIIDGDFHPAFNKSGTSRFVRNGVGVDGNGQVVFVKSTEAVTFWEFAEQFEALGVDNALYLDGAVSRMEYPVRDQPLFVNVPFGAILSVSNEESR